MTRHPTPTDETPQQGLSSLLRLHARAPRGSSREAVTVGLRAMALLAWLMIVPLAVAPLVRLDIAQTGGVRWQTWALIVSQLPAVIGLVWPTTTTWWLWGCGLMALFVDVAWLPLRSTLDPLSLWSPGYWSIAWATWGVLVVPRRSYRLLAGIGSLVFMAADIAVMWRQGQPLTGHTLAPLPWFAVPTAQATLIGHGLFGLAEDADRQAARRRAAQRQREHDTQHLSGAREAARVLHDHVLHALNAMARPGTVPADMVVQECRDAVAAVDQATSAQGMVRVTDLLAADPLVQALDVTISGRVDPLPGSVAAAMAGAAHEALSNVARHAGTTACQVHVEQQAAQWRLTVTDQGRGFHTERRSVGRLGLSRSVIERVADAGGAAVVTSAPGQGTTVDLRWPAAPEDDPTPLLSHANGTMRVMLARTAWPGLVVSAFMAMMVGHLVQPAWPAQLASLVLVVLGGVTTAHLEKRRLEPWWAVTLLVLALGGWWLNLTLLPGIPHDTFSLWMGWEAGAIVHLVLLQLRIRYAVAGLVAWSVPAYWLLVHHLGTADALRLQSSLTTGLGECAVALVGLYVAGRVATNNARQAATAEAVRRATAQLQVEWHVEQYWSQQVTGVAMPLLRLASADGLDVTSPRTQATAHALEQTLRDELVLGPSNRPMLHALAQLRADGWEVASLLSSDDPPAALTRFAALLTYIGAADPAGQQVTLSTSTTHAIALVLDPTEHQRTVWNRLVAREEGTVDDSPEFARLRVPLEEPTDPPVTGNPTWRADETPGGATSRGA